MVGFTKVTALSCLRFVTLEFKDFGFKGLWKTPEYFSMVHFLHIFPLKRSVDIGWTFLFYSSHNFHFCLSGFSFDSILN